MSTITVTAEAVRWITGHTRWDRWEDAIRDLLGDDATPRPLKPSPMPTAAFSPSPSSSPANSSTPLRDMASTSRLSARRCAKPRLRSTCGR